MSASGSTIAPRRSRQVKETQATSLRVTPTCLELWDKLALHEGLSRTSYLETTIRRLAAEKQLKVASDLLAEQCTEAAMAGPIGEIWATPEEDEAWAHLEDLK